MGPGNITPQRSPTMPVLGRSPEQTTLTGTSPRPEQQGGVSPISAELASISLFQSKDEHLSSVCKTLGLEFTPPSILGLSPAAIKDMSTPTPIPAAAKTALLDHLCFCHRWINILGKAAPEPVLINFTVEVLKENFATLKLDDWNANQCATNLIVLVTHRDQNNRNRNKFPKTISPFTTFLQGDAKTELTLNNLSALLQNHQLRRVFEGFQVKNHFEMRKVAIFLRNFTPLTDAENNLVDAMYTKESSNPRYNHKKSLGEFLTIFMCFQKCTSQINLSFYLVSRERDSTITEELDFSNYDLSRILTNQQPNEAILALASNTLNRCATKQLTFGDFLEDFALVHQYAECSYPFLKDGVNILPVLISYCKYATDPTPEKFDVILRKFDALLGKIGFYNFKNKEKLFVPLFSSYYMYHSNESYIDKLSTSLVPSTVDIVVPSMLGICSIDCVVEESISEDELCQIISLAVINKDIVIADTSCSGHLFSKALTGLNHAVLLFNNNGVYTILIKPNVYNDYPLRHSDRKERLQIGGEKRVKLQGVEITVDPALGAWKYQRAVTVSKPSPISTALNRDTMQEYVEVVVSKSVKPTDIGRSIYYTRYLGKPLQEVWPTLSAEDKKKGILKLVEKFRLSYQDVKMANVLIDGDVHFIDHTARSFTYVAAPVLLRQAPDAPLSVGEIAKNAIFGLCTIFFELCNDQPDRAELVKNMLKKLHFQHIHNPDIPDPSDDIKDFTFFDELNKARAGELTLEELGTALQKLYPDITFARVIHLNSE